MKTIRKIHILGGKDAILKKEKVAGEEEIPQWFKENCEDIKQAAVANPFWQEKLTKIEIDQKLNPYVFLRRLDDLGYKKVHKVSSPGEFAHRGGLIDVYPINREKAVRIEFVGNKIESIFSLQPVQKEEMPFVKENPEGNPNFKKGYYVVHVDHGIGRYEGKTEKFGREYLKIAYKDNDILFVPPKAEDRVSPFIGFKQPRVHRLGGSLWQKTKQKAREETIKWAEKIIEERAARETTTRKPYHEDGQMQKSLEADFPYQLTSDQRDALQEVKADLHSDTPLDRLICGDVGFGKTEIALRAAFKVASQGRQVVFMTPTTILADQHFQTFKNRLEDYPVGPALLSRVQTKREQKRILNELSEGQIDILCGTHRVLSEDVKFNDLGLLVIDEEQKFGVRHKEKLREVKRGLDVLSLSATPIPRTLKMALSDIRDISLIKTPPPQKQPIETKVRPFKKEPLMQAVRSELDREGQVFYLHNRIQSIKKAKSKLESLFPDAEIKILHARMNDKKVIDTMHKFRRGKFDVLVTTTIIENGLDLGNVNTLIVENSDQLGLAQAHQLRGRIGRTEKKAYAWFFYRPKNLTAKIKKRLNTLKEFSHLGAGFQIALKDLKMRGAGEILGKKQSGTIQKVGLNLYYQLLEEAVEKIRRKEKNQV